MFAMLMNSLHTDLQGEVATGLPSLCVLVIPWLSDFIASWMRLFECHICAGAVAFVWLKAELSFNLRELV